jgi:hypothetical protein
LKNNANYQRASLFFMQNHHLPSSHLVAVIPKMKAVPDFSCPES